MEPTAPPSATGSQNVAYPASPALPSYSGKSSAVGKLRALRQSQDKLGNLQVVLYNGATDRGSYFKKLQEDIEPALFEVSLLAVF